MRPADEIDTITSPTGQPRLICKIYLAVLNIR